MQHPAATPAHGTPTAPADPGPAPQQAYPTDPGPVPQPSYPTDPGPVPQPSYPTDPGPVPQQAYPTGPGPVPQPSYPTGPGPAPQQAYPTDPGPVPQQAYPADPGQAQPQPYPGGDLAPASRPAAPIAQPQPYPGGDPGQVPPQPYPGGAPGSAQPGPYPAAAPHPPSPYPAAPGTAHLPETGHAVPFGGGSWQRYDPWAAPQVREEARTGRSKRVVVVGAVLLALVAGVVGGAIGSYLERNGGTDVELPQAGAESAHRAPDSVAGIAARALPGVVTIHTKGSSEQGTGTGFVLDDRGHILTNNHVVEPAGSGGRISVTFAGGESADADVVGHDSGYDLAVIKVSGVRGLKPLALGNSQNVQVGDPVVAIGAPFDLANTVTSGIISAKDRPITAGGEKGDGTDVSYVDALQTDAPINPGNSGGPLVDSRARVIGINSAIRSADSGSELEGGQSGSIGLGFAIPINQAKRVAEELINTGRATHPVIGVTLDMDYAGDGARVGVKGNDGGSAVSPGGPGARAGIEPGDVITEVDGVRVHSGEELIVKIRAHRPKDKLDVTLERGGREREVTLVLGSAPSD
ncbi:trypsin-like peptidase domain-containing protein [Streptomyces sp. NPDC049813]|uniref:trypsin-like peptidase domain-containing protein n=1 Tax=Streptomyces sp. NPDC049813 TaxID=3365597 RepID=UPI00379CADEC